MLLPKEKPSDDMWAVKGEQAEYRPTKSESSDIKIYKSLVLPRETQGKQKVNVTHFLNNT